eukprot:2269126-Amphidinium_carterae.2
MDVEEEEPLGVPVPGTSLPPSQVPVPEQERKRIRGCIKKGEDPLDARQKKSGGLSAAEEPAHTASS